jgi:trigger factor
MKAQVESISPVKRKLTIQVPPEDVSREEESLLRELRSRTTVPGFRKGKAPPAVIRRMYGDRIRSDVLERLVGTTFQDAVRQENLVPVSDPDIELQDYSPDAGIAYTVVVEVRPQIKPRGYTGLHLKKEKVVVPETEVDARLEALRAQRTTFEPAPEGHALARGDMALLDYRGTIGGEPFEGGQAQDRTIVLGSGNVLPGFEDGLLGATAGEEREVEVTFPEDYPVATLAGQLARFQVTVKDVKVARLPEVDEEFAQEVAGVATAEELRERVRDVIASEKRRRAEDAFRDRVITALLDANPFEVPETLVRNQQAFSLDRMRRDLTSRGMDPEALGIGRAEVQEVHRRAAEHTVRWAFLLRAIAEAEGLTVSDEEVDERIRAIAEADGRPYAAVRKFFEEGDRLDTLRSHLLDGKVVAHVVAASTVDEVEGLDREETAP